MESVKHTNFSIGELSSKLSKNHGKLYLALKGGIRGKYYNNRGLDYRHDVKKHVGSGSKVFWIRKK